MAIESDDVYVAAISELIVNFRDALIAILPVARRAMIPYEDDKHYRHWESLADNLFNTFVRDPIETDRTHRGRNQLRLARYDIDVEDYAMMSWLTVDDESPHRGVFVRFLSCDAPFDSVQVVDVDPGSLRADGCRTVSALDIRPALYRRFADGEAVLVTRIEADD